MPAIGGGGGSANGTTLRIYSTAGVLQATVTNWPTGVTLDTTIEPYLDINGSLTLFGWTGTYESASFVTVTVLASGTVGSAVALPQYQSPTLLHPWFPSAIPAQPPNYHTVRTGPFSGGGLGQINFSDVAMVKNWNQPAAGALGTNYVGDFGWAWGPVPAIGSASAYVSWSAPQRGWVAVDAGQVQWLKRSPQVTCWAPFGGTSNTKVWQVAETSEGTQTVVLYSVLGATNGNLLVYREQHHWSPQTVYEQVPFSPTVGGIGPTTPTPYAHAIAGATQPTHTERWVDSSSYSLVLLSGADGSLLAQQALTGYGSGVSCTRSPGCTMAVCSIDDLDLTGFWSYLIGEVDGEYTPLREIVTSDGTRTNGELNFFDETGEIYGDGTGNNTRAFTTVDEAGLEANYVGYEANTASIDFASVKPVPRALLTFVLPPEPNLSLIDFASDGVLVYLVSGPLTDGVASLPTANQEQALRVFAYSATSLILAWSVALPVTVATGATAKILSLNAHLHVLAYDGTATTHFWLDRATGAVVAPLDSVARTNPAQLFASSAGQLAFAFGNTLRIYQ